MNKDLITIRIPKKTEYISIARLTVAGLASTINFDIGMIEDLKVCLGEACINALHFSQGSELKIEFEVNNKAINIKVEDVMDMRDYKAKDLKELELGMLIIESLMDEVEIDKSGIKMIKYIKGDLE